MTRADGRTLADARPVVCEPGFHKPSEGSVLYRAGSTVVLCTASVENGVPPWMKDGGRGWLTAEYQMHPRANAPRRDKRDGRGRAPSGRTQEIQRLIGRSLRAAVDLERLGERTVVIDCDVLEADGGTRTASITGGFIALALALHKIKKRGDLKGPALRDQVAAISVGHLESGLALDLVYTEDSAARVDLNIVATATGAIVELQGTAEGEAVPRKDVDQMVDLGLSGIEMLCRQQREVLAGVDIELTDLMIKK